MSELTQRDKELIKEAVKETMAEHPCRFRENEAEWVHEGARSIPLHALRFIGIICSPVGKALSTVAVSLLVGLLFGFIWLASRFVQVK